MAHQQTPGKRNAYGFMVNPNMMGSVLARATRGTNTAIIQMGETAVFLNPPIRVAEEYAMLELIAEGRLIAGFPVGLGGDYSYTLGMGWRLSSSARVITKRIRPHQEGLDLG